MTFKQHSRLKLGTVAACALSLGAAVVAPVARAADERPKITIAVGTTVIDASQANNTSIPIYTKCWEKEGLDV
ncbi:MAG: hypothetical protein ABI564_16065, partial [Ideonella sp.]